MTKEEALKMCLEYIETDAHERKYVRHAIKKALAQPEVFSKQNYLNGYCVGQSDLLAEQAKLEPAAWMVYTQDGQSVYVTDNPTDIQENQRVLPMYTTPPQPEPPPECKTEAEKTAYAFGWFKSMEAQRTWVGLTEDEVALIAADCSLVTPSDFYFAQAIEAKLKEKNT